MGFRYPTEAPRDQVLGPRTHPNLLAITSRPLLKPPHMMDVTEGTKNLTEEDYDIIRQNHLINLKALEGYQGNLVGQIGDLYDKMAEGIVSVDAMLTFFLELYAHCDGSLRDLVNTKLSLLFHPDVRDEILGGHLTK